MIVAEGEGDPGAGEKGSDRGLRVSGATIKQHADVAAERRISGNAVQDGEPFGAVDRAVGAIPVDQKLHELDEGPMRGSLGD